jgi:hypothetical protein
VTLNVENIYRDVLKRSKYKYGMIFTEGDELKYRAATVCHICEEPFNSSDKELSEVRDHCRLNGKFRGAAHNICSINYRIPKFIPIYFHNLKYDLSLFVKKLALIYQC